MAATHVFLSYCRDNAKLVAKLREDLLAAGERVWWDQEILPGQDWRLAIRQAMKASYAVVLCLSKEAQARATSGIYPEALDAIDAYRQHAPGALFLIPVRLNECEIPAHRISESDYLDSLNYVDLFPAARRKQGLQRLLAALRAAPGHPAGRESVAVEAESEPAPEPASPATRSEPVAPAVAAERLRRYLDDLRKETGTIAIRGLQVGTGRAYAFPIDRLYISLTTAFDPHVAASLRDAIPLAERAVYDGAPGLPEAHGNVLLQQTLRQSRLVIVGDPGSGKTTFLRRVAFSLCRIFSVGQASSLPGKLEAYPTPDDPFCQAFPDRPLPVFVRLANLYSCMQRCAKDQGIPTHPSSPAWLPYHLADVCCRDHACDLDQAFFQQALQSGRCAVLLDGLDEAPDRHARQTLSQLIENAAQQYDRCRFVVTSRPPAYTEGVVLPAFAHARIDPLSDDAVREFLTRWCEALYPGQPAAAAEHRDELLQAIALRPDIREMVRNPVMLTALAVVHWNERRLPEQRADLYESIIIWLSRSREQRPGRPSAEKTVAHLGKLALAMQDHPEGRQAQVSQQWAADALADRFADAPEPQEAAAAFLHDEELDSGIVVGRGRELRFWHLTFQEYLAAKTIAGMREKKQAELLTGRGRRLYRPEWREVVLLLAGILYGPEADRVDGLVEAILDDLFDEPALLDQQPALADQASCVGLLGGIRSDLSPYGYVPADSRYAQLMQNVMAMFDPEGSRAVPLPTRVAAAEALGRAGDPREGVGLRSDRRGLPDILWCDAPGGTLQMGAAQGEQDAENYEIGPSGRPLPVEIRPFRIAAYTVTNAQFRPFVDGDGYENRDYWTEAGWAWKEEKNRVKPDDWDDPRWNIDNHPVVSVSWYEAVAWCRWLTQRLRAVRELTEDQEIRLPTEAEWEWTARGPDGLRFPWGNDWQDGICNSEDATIGHTSAVGLFPAGASHWLAERTGKLVCDLGGNVWEWCATKWRESYGESADESPERTANRIIRGGCFGNEPKHVRCVCRSWPAPYWAWSQSRGFRCAQ